MTDKNRINDKELEAVSGGLAPLEQIRKGDPGDYVFIDESKNASKQVGDTNNGTFLNTPTHKDY